MSSTETVILETIFLTPKPKTRIDPNVPRIDDFEEIRNARPVVRQIHLKKLSHQLSIQFCQIPTHLFK